MKAEVGLGPLFLLDRNPDPEAMHRFFDGEWPLDDPDFGKGWSTAKEAMEGSQSKEQAALSFIQQASAAAVAAFAHVSNPSREEVKAWIEDYARRHMVP